MALTRDFRLTVAARGLSVRETEALVAKMLRGQSARHMAKPDRDLERLAK